MDIAIWKFITSHDFKSPIEAILRKGNDFDVKYVSICVKSWGILDCPKRFGLPHNAINVPLDEN